MAAENQPKPDWAPLPRPGCHNIDFRVLLVKDGLSIANLRFAENATIDRHDAPYDIDVLCIAGSGFASIDDMEFPITQGQTVRWPNGKEHRLWTIDTTMETIMVERHGG